MLKIFEAEYELEKFKVKYDLENLLAGSDEKCATQEEYDCETSISIGADEDEYNTMEEHNQNIDDFNKAIEDACTEEALLNAISAFPKKKNGTFKKNVVTSVKRLDNSYYSQDEYGWPCDELRLKAIDDNTLELTTKRVVIKN